MICRQAAEAISRSLDAPPSRVGRVGLRVHTLFCGPCRRFRTQLVRLYAACEAASDEPPPGGAGLSTAARERIAAALDKPPAG